MSFSVIYFVLCDGCTRCLSTILVPQRTGTFQQRSTTVKSEDFELHFTHAFFHCHEGRWEVTPNELQYVQQYFVSSYGRDRTNAILKYSTRLSKNESIQHGFVSF
jgi:DnaJ like chaperone protein